MLRPATRGPAAALAALLGLAACATTSATTAATTAPIARPEGPGYGVIVSMRPLGGAQTGGIAGGDEVRSGILRAIGVVTVTDVTASSAAAAPVEFIVRKDDGSTISVVQTDAANFHPGDRVMLTGGARTRLARVPG